MLKKAILQTKILHTGHTESLNVCILKHQCKMVENCKNAFNKMFKKKGWKSWNTVKQVEYWLKMVKAVETVKTIKKNSENKYHFTILITKNGPICDRRKKKKIY